MNANRLCELMMVHENAFYEMFWCDNDITDEQHKYLSSITSQDAIEGFVSGCLCDMINVDKITKEEWLKGGVL